MQIEPGQSSAQEFLGGLEDVLYPKEVSSAEDDFKSGEEDNQVLINEKGQKDTDTLNQKKVESEITKIFSSALPAPALKGQLRETLSKIVLNQSGNHLAERLRSVDRHVRLFFASNFVDLSTAALTYYDSQIEYLKKHPISKQPNDPEIILDVIYKALDSAKNEIGTKLAQEIEELKKLGLNDYAERVENFLHGFVNGSSNLGAFIQSIEIFKDLDKDQLKAVKTNLNTLVTASTQLQKISEENKQLLVKPSEKILGDIQKAISKKYKEKSFPLDLRTDHLVLEIIKLEYEVFDEMQRKKFYFNKKKENFEVTDGLPFIEVIREEIIEKLEPSQLIQILESKKETWFKEDSLLKHWKELCFEAMKGKEVEYLNHLNNLKIDWRTYPWDVFHTVVQNCPVDRRAPFAEFFEKYSYEVPKLQLGTLVDVFFGTFDEIKKKSFVQVLIRKCYIEIDPLPKMLNLLLNEHITRQDKVRSEWNNVILAEIGITDKNLERIAELMTSKLEEVDFPIYFRIFDYIEGNKSYLLKPLRKYLEENNQHRENQLGMFQWGKISDALLQWCWNYRGSFDQKFFEMVIPTPIIGFENAASLRFQDRTKPEPKGGLVTGISTNLEGEALTALATDVRFPLSKQTPEARETAKLMQKAAERIQKKMSYCAFCNREISSISSSISYADEDIIKNQKMVVLKSILEQVRDLKDFPNDFLFIPAHVFGHAMQLTIIKQPQGKLGVYITNTGEGVQNHPSIKGPPSKYATTAKVGEIPQVVGEITQEKLDKEIFWKDLIDIFSEIPSKQQMDDDFTVIQIGKLYNTLKIACGKKMNSTLGMLDHLEGKKIEGEKFFYPVKRHQYGGVCAVSCIRDITKTMFELILFAGKDKKSSSAFADSYLESELAMEYIDHWIADRYLTKNDLDEDMTGKDLKLSKKGASSFEKFAQKEQFSRTRQFLMDKIYGRFSRTQRPMKLEPSLGESAREIKDLTKELVLVWIKENKEIKDVQRMQGHPILEVAKKRFEYKRRAIQQALDNIENMENENTSEKNSLFVINIFKELSSIGAENIVIDQLKRSLPKMLLTSEIAFFLSKLMNLMNKDESSRVNAVKLFSPYMTRLVDKTLEEENISEINSSLIINIFRELRKIGAENIVIDQLKKSIPKMVLTSGNSIFLIRLMTLMNEDKPLGVNAVKLFYPYMMRLIDKTTDAELIASEYVLLDTFCLVAKNEVLDILKPAFENFSKRPFTLAEFYLFRDVLEKTTETVQSKIIENLVSAGKHRDPKLTAKEIILPFILSFTLMTTDNKTTMINLISETEKYLVLPKDKEYLRSLLPETRQRRRSLRL